MLLHMLTNLFKVCIVSVVHIIILFTIAPIIDHAFTPLHRDETNTEILFEIITQLLTVVFIWYILEKYILHTINKYFGLHNTKIISDVSGIVSSVILIGLQSHLVSKLQYITHENPFRVFKLFDT